MASKHSATKQKKVEKICEICGAPDAIVRNFEHPKYGKIEWLQGSICKKCLDAGKEPDYVKKILETKFEEANEYDTLNNELEKLYKRTDGYPDAEDVKKLTDRLDELVKSENERHLLAEWFLKTRMENKLEFISKYGQGVKEEKCEICDNDNAYLCIVEDYFEGKKAVLDELSFWACSDCICKGAKETYFGNALLEFLMFKGVCREFKDNIDLYISVKGTSQLTEEERKNLTSTIIEQFLEMSLLATVYCKKDKLMKRARLAYKGIPVKTVIMTGKVGEGCGKDLKCEDN